ncbi:MAG TPA: sulfite exporter TauE/SafE family protein [Flavisolibacter sp.]|nr:sulfite exporter TauE/SafE family protein [Flavisolibacter sp.]
MTIQIILLLIIIGLAAGILSGLVGVGGGIIVVPALVFFLSFSQQQAQGTSLGLLLLPVGILAVFNYYKQGHIDFRVIGIMAVAFVVGGWLGSRWALTLPEITVKRIFAVILFYSAFKMMGWDAAVYRAIKNIFS